MIDNDDTDAAAQSPDSRPTADRQGPPQEQAGQALIVHNGINPNHQVSKIFTPTDQLNPNCLINQHPMVNIPTGTAMAETPTETRIAVRRKPRKPQVYNPDRHCGAKSRSNNMLPCTHPKGWGTAHPGDGRCKNHGGSAKLSAGGRYSQVMRPTLRAAIEKHDADPRPMDLIPEISLLRALVEDYVGRYDVIRDALLAWHMAIQQGSSTPVIPARLPDITEAGRLIERVARVADTVHRIATEGSISLACYARMQECMGMEMTRIISTRTGLPDADVSRVLDEIEAAWKGIKVDSNRRPT